MLPADNHVHSEWSYDTSADASMLRSCEQAVAIGLPAIAFTEHLEFTAGGTGDAIVDIATDHRWWSRIKPLDVTGYMASIEDCRQRFPGLRILSGVEAGEPHLFGASAGAIVGRHAFNRVLGSLHAVPYRGRLVAADALFGPMSADETMRYYFAELVSLIERSDLFEVLAHLDFPRRYWPKGPHLYREEPFEEEYRAALRALAASDRVLEVNTKSPLASVDLVRWWREEGGTAVSFGSDAHLPNRVGDRFKLAVDVVEAAGFRPGRDPYDYWRKLSLRGRPRTPRLPTSACRAGSAGARTEQARDLRVVHVRFPLVFAVGRWLSETVMDDEQRYAAASSRDARFDGVFFTAVRTTGIYCRPSCPALTPKRSNVVFYPTAAAAQQAGFRACKRCRPDASPGSPEWNVRSDLAGRAMRLIADGVVDRSGVTGLASSLGYSARQVGRLLTAEVGAGPLALARAQRARTARILVETSSLPVGDIAFAAGFTSIRQFNATMLEVYDTPPSVLRERAMRRDRPVLANNVLTNTGLTNTGPIKAGTGMLRLRLPFRPPIDLTRMLGYLAARAIPGIEVASPGEYRRTISLPNGCGLLSLRPVPGANWVECSLALSDPRDVTAAVQRCRRLLDLDADPCAISGFFAGDPVIGPLAADCPGRRAIGAVDGNEIAVRAVLGQQVSVAAARRLAARLVMLCGTPLPTSVDVAGLCGPGADGAGLTHVFPDAATIAGLDPATLPMPLARGRALVTLAAALASGEVGLDPGADWEEVGARLLSLPGIGPWTAGYIRMRALSDPDVFLAGDAGVVRALGGTTTQPPLAARRWRPWRSYVMHHLWAVLESESARTRGTRDDALTAELSTMPQTVSVSPK